MKFYIYGLFILILSSTFVYSSDFMYYSSCVGCHGSNGDKSALGKSAIIKGQEYSKTVRQLTAYKRGKLDLYGYGGLMRDKLLKIDDAIIDKIAKYIEKMK